MSNKSNQSHQSTENSASVRLDKWLWAARFYKTRSLATAAINGGHVHLNDERVKPSKVVKCDDTVRVRKGRFEITVTVQGVSDKRCAAPIAQQLYAETLESEEKRLQSAAAAQALKANPAPQQKPNKAERRELSRIKKGLVP